MSRRITFAILAASATLIATHAAADRECFEDACRIQQEAADAPAAAMQSAEPDAGRGDDAVASAPVNAQAASAVTQAAAPIKALPQVVAEPVIHTPLPLPPSAADEARARREPVRLAPRPMVAAALLRPVPRTAVEVAAPAAVRVTSAVPADEPRAERMPSRETEYRPRRAAPSGGPAVVAGIGAIYAEDDVVRVYPNPQHDPAWKVCQLDSRERDQRRCGAYSYHPYGENGYRPNGVYAAQPAVRAYILAPNAKIIQVED
jgi:hypothetical protein